MPDEKKTEEALPVPVTVDAVVPPEAETTAPEIVEEDVQAHETKETSIEKGYDAIMARLDRMEDAIKSQIKRDPKSKPEPEQEKKEDAKAEEKPIERKPRRVKLFRKRS